MADPDRTCPPTPDLKSIAPENLFGSTSFHRFALIFAGVCMAIACLIVLHLMAMHATHLSKPREQNKYVLDEFTPYMIPN